MLDDVKKIKSEDKLKVLEATEMLWQQCDQAWNETKGIEIPNNYKDIQNVVVVGMGGSHLGAQMIKAVYREELKVPLIIQNEYTCPGYINENSLVIATSFSGNTEEPLSFLSQARDKGAKIICISSGGELGEIAKNNNLPHYIFESTYNPSRIPRYGSGYLFVAQLVFLAKTGVISFGEDQISQIIEVLKSQKGKYSLDVLESENPAKKLAKEMQEKSISLVASEHLSGSAYIFKNQINESAKNFAVMFKIPELNHHLLEGLQYPKTNKDSLHFIFFQSDLYHQKNQKRHVITKEVMKKQGIGVSSFTASTESKLSQAFELLSFTSYVALYLSILNHVDPGPNPWVDYLKTTLGQSLGK